MNRRDTVLALLALVAAPFVSLAQQQGKVRRIGFLAARSRSTASNPDIHYDAFLQGMRELGYVEGKNLIIEWRFVEGKYERIPGLAAELVKMSVEVIVTHGTTTTQALQRATSAIPIVSAGMGDPVGSGIAASLARPGGNITGMSTMVTDLGAKQFELLKAMVLALSRVAVLGNPGNPFTAEAIKNIQTAAQQAGIAILRVDARTPEDIERGFATMTRERAQAVIIVSDSVFVGRRTQIAKLAMMSRIPLMSSSPEEASAGSLMSYGVDLVDGYRRTATYVDKILKGAKPGELPIEQPMRLHLVINRKTAQALGLTIPQELLLRADEVIE